MYDSFLCIHTAHASVATIYNIFISPNLKSPSIHDQAPSLNQAVSQVALLTACHFAESRDHIMYFTDPS